MTKRKPNRAPTEAKILRAAVIVQLQERPYTAAALAAEIGHEDIEAVRRCICRLIKAGHAKAVRSLDANKKVMATYHYSEKMLAKMPHTVSKPFQPTLKEYPENTVSDPFHLPPNFFSRTV